MPVPRMHLFAHVLHFNREEKGIAAEVNELKEVNKGLTIEANKRIKTSHGVSLH